MISAIIMAAGESKRMGRQKLLMPWGDSTVLGHVISVFTSSGVDDIVVVSGADREQIEEVALQVKRLIPIRCVLNPDFPHGEMLSSIQCGLRDVASRGFRAAMIGLGDQPQVKKGIVEQILNSYKQTRNPIVVPSFQKRRGHPWLVAMEVWDELLNMIPPETPRDFLGRNAGKIQYVEVSDDSIFADLDTPKDYLEWRP